MGPGHPVPEEASALAEPFMEKSLTRAKVPRTTNKPGLRKTSVRLDPLLQNTGVGAVRGNLFSAWGSSHTYTIREYTLSSFFP